MNQIKSSNDFYNLHPGRILQAVEDLGFSTTGRYIQLNSYENRVFDLEFENHNLPKGLSGLKNPETDFFNLVIKVYRPNRWSKQAIQEEHDFLQKLTENDMPAIMPIRINVQSLFSNDEMKFCLFPKAMGRMVQELSPQDYEDIGVQLAKLHNVGASFKSTHRPTLSSEAYGDSSLNAIEDFIYPEVKNQYFAAAEEILNFLDDRLNPQSFICLHGDCHKGNILQSDPKEGPKQHFFVDLDDFCIGPVVQDFWMLLSQTNIKNNTELEALLSGYETLRTFDYSTLELIPALQGLRIIYYAGWIAKRWSDPSFKMLFPQYLEYKYWAEEALALQKCLEQF